MSAKFLIKSVFALMLPLSTLCGLAQMPNAYGVPISLEKAKMVAAPALNEARKNNWTVAVAIVGAIGVSGATSQQDGQCAKAGADALK